MKTVIKVENLSKQYRLGQVGTGTLSHDLNRWWHRVRGKEDPYLKIGESNDRASKGTSEYVWALKDINFEVKEGEVLGIIGKNGAGKSTLLKILSKVTGPTTGAIKAKGRIASLLEVGTGFHPELTGRENIYLNGTILGMTKAEVKAKLDEIVDFAGVARYLDTPVKRYSSGMMVRLGFAVAAHLEPEILIVDEVLAVGDAEFQKKAIGKMKDVSIQEGRTILFVSHNMSAVRNICNRGILLVDGSIEVNSSAETSVAHYLKSSKVSSSVQSVEGTNSKIIINNIILTVEKAPTDVVPHEKPLRIEIEAKVECPNMNRYDLVLRVKDDKGDYIFVTGTGELKKVLDKEKANALISVELPGYYFNEGSFFADLLITENRHKPIGVLTDILSWSVLPPVNEDGGWFGKTKGPLRPKLKWECHVI